MNIKTCRHCDMSFQRDDAVPIPHDRCERCHEEIEAIKELGYRAFGESPDEAIRRLERVMANVDKRERGDMEARSKYHREIKPGVWVDVYDVLKAFDVRNGALQHLIKKALAPGQRGHKDLMEDLDDIISSAKRAKELEQ